MYPFFILFYFRRHFVDASRMVTEGQAIGEREKLTNIKVN
jgi:hypothetical protein